MKGNGWFCNGCKQVGHIEQYCKNKNKNANVSSIKFDSCYLLTNGANGVKVGLLVYQLWAQRTKPFGC